MTFLYISRIIIVYFYQPNVAAYRLCRPVVGVLTDNRWLLVVMMTFPSVAGPTAKDMKHTWSYTRSCHAMCSANVI